jgi:hypothetical protein
MEQILLKAPQGTGLSESSILPIQINYARARNQVSAKETQAPSLPRWSNELRIKTDTSEIGQRFDLWQAAEFCNQFERIAPYPGECRPNLVNGNDYLQTDLVCASCHRFGAGTASIVRS